MQDNLRALTYRLRISKTVHPHRQAPMAMNGFFGLMPVRQPSSCFFNLSFKYRHMIEVDGIDNTRGDKPIALG
jgi:hypothetical protein